MLYQQIPALFYSLKPRFDHRDSIKLNTSQYEQLKALVNEYCHSHDAARFRGLIRRIHRRMEQSSDYHLWFTEYEYISLHLMSAMKEVGYCRNGDDKSTVLKSLNRTSDLNNKPETRLSRRGDQLLFSHSVKEMFDRWLH